MGMNKKYFRFLSLVFFLIGILFLLNSKMVTTGSFIGILETHLSFSSFIGIIFIIFSLLIFIKGEMKREKPLESRRTLEEIVKTTENYRQSRFNEGDKIHPYEIYGPKNAIDYILEYGESPSNMRLRGEGSENNVVEKRFRAIIVFSGYKENLFEKVTKRTRKMEDIWRAANRKIYELSESGELGTLGINYKFVPHTNGQCIYLRTRSGARIFLRILGENKYEFIAVCYGGQKKREEESIIRKIQEMYSK